MQVLTRQNVDQDRMESKTNAQISKKLPCRQLTLSQVFINLVL